MRICAATLGVHHFVLDIGGRRVHMAESSSDESAIERAAAAVGGVAASRALGARIRGSDGFARYDSNDRQDQRRAGRRRTADELPRRGRGVLGAGHVP
ncbi:hypothetical protein C5N14_27505 [Micromonospora sp. MW-13]|nr:hypothetical protein C5N14_27505 [Micromonospora sp. MW-13]